MGAAKGKGHERRSSDGDKLRWNAWAFFDSMKRDYQRVLQDWEATEAESIERAQEILEL